MRCLVLLTLFFSFEPLSGTSSMGEYYNSHTGKKHTPVPVRHFPRRNRRNSVASNEVTCRESPIQQNVTLRGGIQAGYFRKLAQHVVMRLCVELCCEEKGCDLAFMWGKNCYGVQCFTRELCEVIPATPKVPGPIMISHVTFHGQKSTKEEKSTASIQPQCTSTQIQPGVTLRGGIKAGNFTHIGTVINIKTCVKLCCAMEHCNIALVINDQCFAVWCFSNRLCEMTKAYSKHYKPQLAYVQKEGLDIKPNDKAIVTSDNDFDDNFQNTHNNIPAENQLLCKNSQIFHNTTLKGGYRAGNYTNFGKVDSMTECVRLCCGNRNCDTALMLENNCFSVACKDSDNCLPVHAKSTHALSALNPRVSFITSRSEEVSFSKKDTPEGVCQPGVVSYDVGLRGGSSAGNFTPHGKVKSMKACIWKCCMERGCSVAMMLRKVCYTVQCKNERLCEKREIPITSTFNPRIVYVFKEKKTHLDEELRKGFGEQNWTLQSTIQSQKKTNRNNKYSKTLLQSALPMNYPNKVYASTLPYKNNRKTHLNTTSVNTTSQQTKIYKFIPTSSVPKKTTTVLDPFLLSFLQNNTSGTSNSESRKTPIKFSYQSVIYGPDYDRNLIIQNGTSRKNAPLNLPANFPRPENINKRINNSDDEIYNKKASSHSLSTINYNSSPSNSYLTSFKTNMTLFTNDLSSFKKSATSFSNLTTPSRDLTSDFRDSENTTAVNEYLDDLDGEDSDDDSITTNNTVPLAQKPVIEQDKKELNLIGNTTYHKWEGSNNTRDIAASNKDLLSDTETGVKEPLKMLHATNYSSMKLNNGNGVSNNDHLITSLLPKTNHPNNIMSSYDNEPKYSSNVVSEQSMTSPLLSHMFQNHALDSDDPTCRFSDILHNLTLRGNLHAGKFTDRGEMKSIKQCAKLCCMLKGCDLAFMLYKTCFTVECLSQTLCDPVPAKSTLDSPTLCYVILKMAS